jgi:hypothetical protein
MIAPTGGKHWPPPIRDTPVTTLVNSAVCFLGAASAVAGGVSWLLTFTPWTQFMSASYFVPFFVLAFPLFFWSVFVVMSRQSGQPERRTRGDWQALVSRRARVTLTVIGVAVGATFLASMASLPGQPEYDSASHRYVYDEHGVLVPTTRTAWLHAVAAQNRLFLGGAVLFTSVAVAITWAERKRRDRVSLTRLRHQLRPGTPVGSRPSRVPPGPLLAVAVAASLAGLIACAVLIIGRIDAYNGDATYLQAGQPVRAVLPPDDYVVFVGCTQDMACPRLVPGDLSARVADGGILAVSSDPSSDHLSENAQPFVGELSFSVRQREAVSLELDTRAGQPVFIVRSEGAEARALAGWIALAVLSLGVLVGAVIGLGVLLTWKLGFSATVAPGPRVP